MTRYKPVFFDIETTGFNPTIPGWWSNKMASEVTGVAVGQIYDWDEDGEDRYLETYMNRGSEYKLIESVREELARIGDFYREQGWEPFLVGHNIIQFDCLYWGSRAARFRQDSWPVGYGWRRLDTMRALSIPADHPMGPKQYPGQQEYADLLGLEYVDELDGSDMPEAFKDGRLDEIETHVKDDVSTLMDIFMEEREDMVDEFWGHYDSSSSEPLEENRPSFTENVTIDVGKSADEE